MRIRPSRHALSCFSFAIAFVALTVTSQTQRGARAASISLVPSATSVDPGETFTVTVQADSSGEKVLGLKSKIFFDSAAFAFEDLESVTDLAAPLKLYGNGSAPFEGVIGFDARFELGGLFLWPLPVDGPLVRIRLRALGPGGPSSFEVSPDTTTFNLPSGTPPLDAVVTGTGITVTGNLPHPSPTPTPIPGTFEFSP